jgi:hypothetical protein
MGLLQRPDTGMCRTCNPQEWFEPPPRHAKVNPQRNLVRSERLAAYRAFERKRVQALVGD